MRIYVGPALLDKNIPMEVRSRNLIYRLVQKTLNMFIHNQHTIGRPSEYLSHTSEVCKRVAATNDFVALRHPGCWVFFLNSFRYTDPFEIPPWLFNEEVIYGG